MEKIGEIINNLCPNGVEYKEIGELFIIKNGYTPSKNNKEFWDNGNIPWFRMEDIRTNGKILNESIQHITEKAVKGDLFKKNSLMVATTATIGVHALIETDFLCNQQLTCVSIKDKYEDVLNIKFYFYYFDLVDKECIKIANQGGGMPIVSLEKMKKIKVPVPPLKVQNEIVSILDNYTSLTEELITELSTELKKREKQFDFYFKQIMFNKSYPVVKIEDIGQVKMCRRILKSQTNTEGGIPFYKIGTFGKEPDAYISEEMFEEYVHKYSYPKKGDVLISCSGTIGRTVIFDGKPAYFQDSNIVWLEHDEDKVLNEYLKYCYKMSPWKIATGGTIARLYNDNILKAEIPLPSAEEQRKIISILSNFEKIHDDLVVNLSAEIEMIQKQYEYYRNLLLNFKEVQYE